MSIAGPSAANKEIGSESYGMGFFLTSYRGHYLVHHGGNIDGFTALVTFMPQDNIGMIILSNQNASQVPTVVSYNIYDRLLGLDQIDWTKRMKTRGERGGAGTEEAKQKGYTAQVPGTHPSHDLADYAGEYQSPAYGLASVSCGKRRTEVQLSRRWRTAESLSLRRVRSCRARPAAALSGVKVSFHTNLQGDVDSLSVPFEPSVKEIVFTRLRRSRE